MLPRLSRALGRAPAHTRAKSHVPVVDFAGFSSGDAAAREQTALDIVTAFREVGFVTLVNHPTPAATLQKAFEMQRAFFALDADVKNALAWDSPESNRGFLGPGAEALAEGQVDIKETMEIGDELDTAFANKWPAADVWDRAGEFKAAMLDMFEAANDSHMAVDDAIGVGLGLGEGYFAPLCDGRHQNLRLLYYPATTRAETDRNPRAGAHTDYGFVTLLYQLSGSGLQVQDRAGEWHWVEPVEGAVNVNVGDCLRRWTNDELRSTPHRVLADPRYGDDIPERFSIAAFGNPNKDTVVERLPVCKEPAKYEPITAGAYLAGRLADTISMD